MYVVSSYFTEIGFLLTVPIIPVASLGCKSPANPASFNFPHDATPPADHLGGPPLLNGPTRKLSDRLLNGKTNQLFHIAAPPPEVNPVTGLSTLLNPSRQTRELLYCMLQLKSLTVSEVIYDEAHFPMEHTNEACTWL